ncbi:MAG TPA: glycosyltransferase, partial [Candidatus Methylacidiphilales bacterium]
MSPDPAPFLWLWTGAAAAWWAVAWGLSRPRAPRTTTHPADAMRPPVAAFRAVPRLRGSLPEDVAASLRALAAQLRPGDQLLVAHRPEDGALLGPLFAEVAEIAPCPALFLPRADADRWANPKVDAYAQLAPHARHPLWFWSDADIRLPADGLAALLGAWTGRRPGTGFVTCLYRIPSVPDARALPEALFVNAEFFPGARLLARGERLRCAFGAGILFAPPEGESRAAFWERIGPCLADDHALGRLLGPGLGAPFEAETAAGETTWRGAVAHYYRWHKTIRWCAPIGFAGQIVLHPSLGWIGWLLLGGGVHALHGLGATLLLEA